MSLYNMISGRNIFTYFLLPMIDLHEGMVPRFRDVFLKDPEYPEYDNMIHIYTRVGGNNRESYEDDIEILTCSPYYEATFDDSFDSTYATYVFKVPKKWEVDFEKVRTRDFENISLKFTNHACEYYSDFKDKIAKAIQLAKKGEE